MAATPDTPGAATGAAEAAYQTGRDTVPTDSGAGPPTRASKLGSATVVPAPRRAAGRRGRQHAPLVLAAAVAAGWAMVLSAGPVVLIMALTRVGADTAAAIQIGLAGWLLGHGVPLNTGAGRLGLVPLGLTLLAGWRVIWAGVHTTRGIRASRSESVRRALAVAGAVGVWYGLFGGLAALVVGDDGEVGVSAARATATMAAFGAGFSVVGAARSTGVLAALWRWLPALVSDGVRTGVVAALLVLAAAAALVGGSLALGAGEAGDVLGAYRTGVTGQAGITLICLVYAPNCAVWAASYLVGPGFSVGAESLVRITDVTVGGLPAIPIFAALPAGPLGAIGAVLIAVPVIAGMVSGWLLTRYRLRMGGVTALAWPGLLGAAALAGPVAGAVLGALALAASGSLGGGRMAHLGPVAWQVAALGTGVVVAGAMIGAAARRSAALSARRANR